jgi:hypothetical protein
MVEVRVAPIASNLALKLRGKGTQSKTLVLVLPGLSKDLGQLLHRQANWGRLTRPTWHKLATDLVYERSLLSKPRVRVGKCDAQLPAALINEIVGALVRLGTLHLFSAEKALNLMW